MLSDISLEYDATGIDEMYAGTSIPYIKHSLKKDYLED